MECGKVFKSDITRSHNVLQNNLYDILMIDPVSPLPINNNQNQSCNFTPKIDKYFIPKKKIKLKVRTVRDIRNMFEKDIYTTLESDLVKQQNILLRKITGGSSKDEKTKLLAKNMLNSETPMSRMTWQMLINVNPDNHTHSPQYVLWNGKCIRVNGSRGGKSKFLCKYTIDGKRTSLLKKIEVKKNNLVTKKSLLKHSLLVKFKPGPLSRKKHLDISYQKYNIGNVQLTHLPKSGLNIIPEYGKPLEPSLTNFLHNLRDINGIISDKWAEFAVSTLGTEENGRAVQLNKDCCVTFDLNYKYNKRRLLMRYGSDKNDYGHLEQTISSNSCIEKETSIQEIKDVLNDILISVEISLLGDNVYTGEDSLRDVNTDDISTNSNINSKDKLKRNGELHRLDVTVIRLSETQERDNTNVCRKSFCALGCVCDSILSTFHLKNHCARVECMFECKCDFTKYEMHESFEDDIIPGLVHLDNENNLKLSKEEQKFHQTVVLSGEKSILLKSQKRNWKAPKKYADFYSNLCLKTEKKSERMLSVVDIQLNCTNIEPWCMVHNLYKCFCKGKFTERLSVSNDLTKSLDDNNSHTKLDTLEDLEDGSKAINNETAIKDIIKRRPRQDFNIIDKTYGRSPSTDNIYASHKAETFQEKCARTRAYTKRKYSDSHYLNANKRIAEMEQNDKRLRRRMIDILKNFDNDDKKKAKQDLACVPTIDLSMSPEPTQINDTQNDTNDDSPDDLPNNTPKTDIITGIVNKKIKTWLAPILTMYRQRFSTGFFKRSLDPPRNGKVALYPWDFILQRYNEKKNFFFVTNQKPFRIFMAVDNRNPMFDNCININSIVNCDNYPLSVKNIVKNKSDELKENICILRGLDICWELVGTVKKVRELQKRDHENSSEDLSSDTNESSTITQPNNSTISSETIISENFLIPLENDTEQSKWFIMSIENDFSEIQFHNRGFFVKHDSIIKAIKVARLSEKTVRLSSQKSTDGNSEPQFGIYAVPNANEYCVFIGPYEKHESLGIETIKTSSYGNKKKTRGVWITTNKVDNLQVIDNPLSLMSQMNMKNEQSLDDLLENCSNIDSASGIGNNKQKIFKLVKPIKIPKTNNFYHLTSSGILKQIPVSPEKPNLISKTPFVINKCLSTDYETNISNTPLLCKGSTLLLQSNKNLNDSKIKEKQNLSSKKPIAEIAPQVKIINECSESSSVQPKQASKLKGGMLILKPEEINKRSLTNKINYVPSSTISKDNLKSTAADNDIDMDIENFLANSVECSAPNTDVYIISDDEDYCYTGENSNQNNWNDVWIICKNVDNIGWIAGRQNVHNELSFEFPGFKYTDFYTYEEAFRKISQVLSRKIYIPKHLDLEWTVVERKEDLKDKQKLVLEDLSQNRVLTKKGLIHKVHLAALSKASNVEELSSSSTNVKTSPNDVKKEVTEILQPEINFKEVKIEIDEECDPLEDLLLKKEELSNFFPQMSNDKRQEIRERLRSIMSSANSS